MSIKKLFDSTDTSRNYLKETDDKNAFEAVESGRNVRAIKDKQDTFVPQVDYSDPAKFAKYGSAYLYYKSAMSQVYDYYPYDGSDAEINEYYNRLLDIEKYVFNNLYPRTNGLIHLSADGWGTIVGSQASGYGLPNTLEYISFYGGPHTASYSKLHEAFPTDTNNKYQYSNIYDEDIYTSDGKPSDYGSGSRESNLKCDFGRGVTVEFWLKKDSFTIAKTKKEVIFDIWNTNASSSADYGRLRIELNGSSSVSPFLLTALSGTTGISSQIIGTSVTTGSLSAYHHYAISFYNSGSTFNTKLYVDGVLDDHNTTAATTINEIGAKNMKGHIGSLCGSPSGSTAAAGWGKLSGSLDEFRFWKVRRDSNQIARYWKTQVRGGTNTDISNTTLGLYYKFNEGITTDTAIDKTVLDYSGRISNGSWIGYGSNSRSTGSAIVLASASATEYRDPIIYSSHPSVSELETSLTDKGTYHDVNNNAMFVNLLPSWVLEESEDPTTDLRKVSHIVATYFDKLALQIGALTKLKRPQYTSASATPLPFAQHLPQSMGLYTPEIFVDSTVLERFMNRSQTQFMEGDLEETKNLIYLNLYNSLTGIYKSKGTEKSIKNVLRCFNFDDRVVKFKTYSDGETFILQNNKNLVLEPNASVNHSNNLNLGGVVFQKADSSNAQSYGFISGTYESGKESRYGMTVEANVIFPSFERRDERVERGFTDVSLFGVALANTASAADTTWAATDPVNLQVYAVRDEVWSKNVYFKLTSSVSPFPFPVLTSSTYFGVYNNEEWNLSVRLKPSIYPLADVVSGSGAYTYDLEFAGINTLNDTVKDSFILTSSISQAVGLNILKSAKRLYAGARRTNVTGTVQARSDILFTNMKYWTKYLEYNNLKQHSYDINNAGISGSYKNISALDSNLSQIDSRNANTLALHWTFDNITGSDSGGNFYYVQDMSSGSATLRSRYGWPGAIAGYQHTGYGYGFQVSSTDVVKKDLANIVKFTDPESPTSANMINVFGDREKVFGTEQTIPKYFHVVEKSLYDAISQEMLSFFAGVIDFNNVIGEPINRYRMRYKTLEKLRETFFQRVTDVASVEKFVEYYKWLDDAIAIIISQLVPAGAPMSSENYNMVESHVLERNKYKTQFPTMEFVAPDPETPMMGINEQLYNWRINHAPISNNQGENTVWWKERADRLLDKQITSGDTAIDRQRENIREGANIVNTQTSSTVSTVSKQEYQTSVDVLRTRAAPYRLVMNRPREIKGGVNFESNKNIGISYNATAPAGPVNRTPGQFVPINVLLAFAKDINAIPVSSLVDPSKKVKRYFGVHHGREWQDGTSYYNAKSSFVFPFNVISASVPAGYNKAVDEKVIDNVVITNLHNDVYGPDMEKPMQGPFTDYAVGGHQSRHVKLNPGTDTYTNRPEAWKLLLGKCGDLTGAIGLVGADYPWPEANNVGARPYPMTASQKAVYYRGFTAKRPVNIRNIHCTTGSTILGNYFNNYEVVQTVGAYSNPRGFVENPPVLPVEITQTPSASQARSFLDIRRATDSHFDFIPEYSVAYLHDSSSANQSVIRSRFSAPGGIDTLGQGYGDIRSDEYSVYNARNYRNWSVLRPFQNMSGTVSEPTGIGTPGIRAYDINGKDFGLYMNLTRHCGKFGRSSLLVTNPGASYEQAASYVKVNRNPRHRLVITGKAPVYGGASLSNTQNLNFPSTNQGCLVMSGSTNFSGSSTLLAAVTSSGFSYSGWLWFGAGSANRTIFNLGRGNVNDFAQMDFVKKYVSAEHRFYVGINSQNASSGGSARLGQWYITGAAPEQWHHIAVTWTGSQGSLSSAKPTIYLNGASSSWTLVAAPYDYYEDDWASNFTFKGFSSVLFSGDNFMAFGSDYSSIASRAFSGSMDEISLWKRPLSAAEVSGLYNGGVPCDVTASAAYTSGSMFDWIRCGELGGSINNANPGSLSVTNVIKGFVYSNPGIMSYLPIALSSAGSNLLSINTTSPTPLAGCSPTVVGWQDTYATSSQYDNFWIKHQIPRADRQYAWITGALSRPALYGGLRYYGYAPTSGPQEGYYQYSSSAGLRYDSYFSFVSASSVRGTAGTASIYQPAMDLNIYVIDSVDESSDNTLGFPTSDNITGAYANDTFLIRNSINPTSTLREADYFNLIMTKRKNTFGYRATPQNGPVQNPVLRKHKREGILTTTTSPLNRYTYKPFTDRGLTILTNMDINTYASDGTLASFQNLTLKTSYVNERLYFSDPVLNENLELSPTEKDYLFEQLVTMANTSDTYTLNWVLYSERMFPTKENEYTSGSSTRVGYDNLYWRGTELERYNAHTLLVVTNSYGETARQTIWPLDAPLGFLTRSSTAVASIQYPSTILDLRLSNSAGELQNEYLHAVPGPPSVTGQYKTRNSVIAGLYARKHMLGGSNSVVSPSGIPIPETGSHIATGSADRRFDNMPLYTGEAYWDAPANAGVIQKVRNTFKFVSYPSHPWFKDYDEYKDELTTVSKGYAVVPEFRISEHIEDYEKYGLSGITDTFEIVGTGKDSSQSGFYVEYSNAEFMKGFADMSSVSLLEPDEIRLVCSASIRLMPYKGFYPAQRTMDLVKRFKNSYSDSVIGETSFKTIAAESDGAVRPLAQTLFAPGLLYNTIKSGMAVDYPLGTVDTRFKKESFGRADGRSSKAQWMIASYVTGTFGATGVPGPLAYHGGEIWDQRAPFEAIMEPEKYLGGISLYDREPHPSASLEVTASLSSVSGDSLYTKMASNFFGEIGNFFLKDSSYSTLESGIVPDDLRFVSGSIYGARLKLRRSMSGSRIYVAESGSGGNNSAYGTFGAKFYDLSTSPPSFQKGATYPLPQDPRQLPSSQLQENFTLYSRPTAFGPAVSGRPEGVHAANAQLSLTSPVDSLGGFNWSFTPPYYNGEAWLDLIFEPDPTATYDLEKILSELKTRYWRIDPGPSASIAPALSATGWTGTQLIPTISGNYSASSGRVWGDTIYGGKNVNPNAMQLSASINCFGVERVMKTRVSPFGTEILTEDETVGMKWVIQPKMETPMPNFNNAGARPITAATGTLSIPTYASQSVPRGIWHQFGVIEPDPNKGIFLEIGDIPTDWLRNHYDVIHNNTIYNQDDAVANGSNMFRKLQPLTDVVSFDSNNVSRKLGAMAESKTIKEAIVAIPYQSITIPATTPTTSTFMPAVADSKRFFAIDSALIEASLATAVGSADGDSLAVAGLSIRRMVETMQNYILPPQFDFLNNADADPMVMYFFEFEYTFDKDDLNYIWQNLAPRGYKKITKTASSTAHTLGTNELLTMEDVMNEDTRWMVFKVKQRGQKQYEDLLYSQAGSSISPVFSMSTMTTMTKFDLSLDTDTYKLEYNWPYDYVSFVESIKFDSQVMYREHGSAIEIPTAESTEPESTSSGKVPDSVADKMAEYAAGSTAGFDPSSLSEMAKETVVSPDLFNAIKGMTDPSKTASMIESGGTLSVMDSTTKRTPRAVVASTARKGSGCIEGASSTSTITTVQENTTKGALLSGGTKKLSKANQSVTTNSTLKKSAKTTSATTPTVYKGTKKK